MWKKTAYEKNNDKATVGEHVLYSSTEPHIQTSSRGLVH